MDSERWQRIETLFDAALDLDPSRWDTFLDDHCRNDPALRAEVAALLASHVAPAEATGAAGGAGILARLIRWRIPIALSTLAIAIVALVLALRAVRSQRDAAIRRGVQAEEATRAARADGYVNAIAAAEASIRAHETGDARRRLEETPENLRGWEWHHLWGRLDRSLYTIPAHSRDVTRIAFARNEAVLVTASRDGSIALWKTASGDSLLRVRSLGADVASIALRASDGTIAAGLENGTVLVLNAATGAEQMRLAGRGRAMVAFNPDGTRLAAAFQDGKVLAWRTDTFKQSATIDAGGAPLCVAYSADGRYLITGDDEGHVKLWDTRTNRRAADIAAHERRITAILTGSGGVFATASLDHTASVWRLTDRKLVTSFRGHEGAVTSLAFASGGREVVSGGADGRILRWSAATGAVVSGLRAQGPVFALDVDPLSGCIAAGGAGGSVRVWPANAEDVRTFRAPEADALRPAVNHARLSDDGTLLACAANRLEVDLYDAASGAQIARLETGRADYPTRVAFSPGGEHLFAADHGGNVIVFDPRSQRRLLAFAAHSAAVLGLDVAPDGDILVSAGSDSTLKFWDARNLAPRGEFRGLSGAVTEVMFAPVGTLATACTDRVIRLWNAATGDTLRVLRGHDGPVIDIAYNHDGARIVSITKSGELRIWNAFNGAVLDRIDAGRAEAVCFSPDGTRILAAGPGNAIRVIDIAARREVARLHGHTARINALETSLHGGTVVSASNDGSVRLWDTARPRR